MSWFKLTTDVMVRGTSRATGEVLDLSESEGQLLVGLSRAVRCEAPAPPEPVCPMPTPEVKKPAVRRTIKPLSQED
jgi:hypothetical protein